MIQSFDVQLQVALRALESVVAPALADAEKHVIEQLHLVLATLSFINRRLPESRRFYRMDLTANLDLAEMVVGLARAELDRDCDELAEQCRNGRALLTDPEAETEEYEVVARRLRDLVTQLSSLAVGTKCQRELETLIIERNGALLMQYRQWCAPFGLELKPDDLPPPAWLTENRAKRK